MAKKVAILDYGSGNLRSAQRAVERVGAEVTVTHDPAVILAADGLLVPGVGAYAACMAGLKKVQGDRMIDERLAGSRPVLGICVGMQILFDHGVEHGIDTPGLGQWPGVVEELEANILPHMGWNIVAPAAQSAMFAGIGLGTRYYFVHSYGVRNWIYQSDGVLPPPQPTWATHEECTFVAAVENGPLWATQFHPEKSGDAGAHLLENWLKTL